MSNKVCLILKDLAMRKSVLMKRLLGIEVTDRWPILITAKIDRPVTFLNAVKMQKILTLLISKMRLRNKSLLRSATFVLNKSIYPKMERGWLTSTQGSLKKYHYFQKHCQAPGNTSDIKTNSPSLSLVTTLASLIEMLKLYTVLTNGLIWSAAMTTRDLLIS